MHEAPSEPYTPAVRPLLNVAFLAALIAIALLAAGCGASFLPDRRMTTRGNIRAYEEQLERRLKGEYNNLPDWTGRISKVDLVLARPPEKSVDRKQVRVEFSQLVYNKWGQRVPQLEEEYFVVTFGHGRPQVVRTDPTIQFGLKSEEGFSDAFPADPTRGAPLPPPATGGGESEFAPPADLPPQSETQEEIPIVPRAAPELVPSRVARGETPAAPSEGAAETTASPAEEQTNDPSQLLRSMHPPRRRKGPLPRAQVRDLPLPEPELE